MQEHKILKGKYTRGFKYAATNWEQICRDHETEFRQIRGCHPGTFNITLEAVYTPPGEDRYRTPERRNYISPCAKIVEINGKQIDAWIYRGGHNDTNLELLAAFKLADELCLAEGDKVTLIVVEYHSEGESGMPSPPSL
jgi:CTP-dependent riboflavin kinase